MATTSGNLAAGTTTTVQYSDGGHGGRFGLRAKLALGVVTLGCAAALAFGGLQGNDPARSRPQPTGQAAGAGYGADQVAWLEQFQVAPAAAPGNGDDADQVTWLERFQTAGPTVPLERYGGDQVAWLEQFELAR